MARDSAQGGVRSGLRALIATEYELYTGIKSLLKGTASQENPWERNPGCFSPLQLHAPLKVDDVFEALVRVAREEAGGT